MAERRNWTWEETLIAFRLYCRTPFGKLHQHNPDIISLAERLGRTPSAVGMKACNFASLDPVQEARGITGLPNRSRFEAQVWERFHDDSEAIAAEAEEAYERLRSDVEVEEPTPPAAPTLPEGPTEETQTVRTRRVQGFFRGTVLISYGHRCALTGLAVPSLLNASHIVPWAASTERRADPRNGICLNALHDRAFDRGLITFDDDLQLMISPALADQHMLGELADALKGHLTSQLRIPDRFPPDAEALAYHRDNVFQVV